MITEIKNALGLNWTLIGQVTLGEVVYYKAQDICTQVSLSNTTIAVNKVSRNNKRKFRTGEFDDNGTAIAVVPWFLTENGVIEMLMLNNTDETQQIKERIATRIIPRVSQLD